MNPHLILLARLIFCGAIFFAVIIGLLLWRTFPEVTRLRPLQAQCRPTRPRPRWLVRQTQRTPPPVPAEPVASAPPAPAQVTPAAMTTNGPPAPTTPSPAEPGKEANPDEVQISLQGANVDMVVQWLAQTTGKTVIKHPRVQCQVTITSSKKLPKREAISLVYPGTGARGFQRDRVQQCNSYHT